MSSFVEQAACRGIYPQAYSACQRRSRSGLVTRLLKKRRIIRYIVAPDGFGKSMLAYEYAHVVFSFKHVFWLGCSSPCFLRDIDKGDIFEQIRRVDRGECLVIFDDLPRLDDDRAEAFSRLVEDLLAAGNEVLVTCAPSSDRYAELHKGRLLIESSDLLLNEEETRAVFGERFHKGDGVAPLDSELIPCLCWGDDGAAQLMNGVALEDLPVDELIAIFVVLLLQNGKLSDVEAFVASGMSRSYFEVLGVRYPFLGIDVCEGSYEAARVEVEDLVAGFSSKVDILASASSFESREAFILRCADALIARGAGDRAIALVLAFSTKRNCARWLTSRAWDLLTIGCPRSFIDAHEKVERSVTKGKNTLHSALAWAFRMIGDLEESRAFARRAAFSPVGDPSARAVGCVMLLLAGEEADRVQAKRMLDKLLMAHELGLDSDVDVGCGESHDLALMWPSLARLAVSLEADPVEGAQALVREIELLDGSADERSGERVDERGEGESPFMANALMGMCAWLFDRIAQGDVGLGSSGSILHPSSIDSQACVIDDVLAREVLRFSCERVDFAMLGAGGANWFGVRLSASMEDAYERDPLAMTRMPSPEALVAARKAQLVLLSGKGGVSDSALASARERSSDFLGTRGSRKDVLSSSRGPSNQKQTPMLNVDLFGAFEVRIGDRVVDPSHFSRQKTRALLAILVLSKGKEFTRDTLTKMLWPKSTEDSAKKSFYALWSKLRKALMVDGECPYLIRDQYGCRLNARLLTSDVARYEELCRTLLFGRAGEYGWEHAYTQVVNEFSEELLPGEKGNDYILTMRDHYHTQMVDALVAASSRLAESGEVRGALWFAREALRRDRTREDAYAAQMEAQIAAGQRTEALNTFFSCRQFLAKELGIDPSVRIVSLYRGIIESEEEID
ncbi:MAG: hypothetical protein IKV48_04090 [Eggerthellaceae bacterium]|nr:hypothetical protein [Eggerthellaceae bacterium]